MSAHTSLTARGLRPRKKWGQHFLTDANLLAHMAEAAQVSPTDTILEIGPGLGHLTRVLAARAARVIAVEIDAALATQLRAEFAATPHVTILPGDILTAPPFDWIIAGIGTDPPPRDYKIVANLPYYITSAILRHVLEATLKPRCIVAMVQREVAQRLIARPPQMNLLAVSVQFFAQPRLVRTIPAGAFYPRPQVDSAIVRLDVYASPRADIEPARWFHIVRAGFGERRKQLRNALANGLGCSTREIETLLTRAHIAPTRRAETLTLDEWQALYRAFTKS